MEAITLPGIGEVIPRLAAAKSLGITPKTLDRWSKAGKIARVMRGARAFFRPSDLERSITASSVPTGEIPRVDNSEAKRVLRLLGYDI